MMGEQETNRGLAALKIIWWAMLLSLAVYWVAGRMAAPGMKAAMGDEAFGTLRSVLYALGFATLVASRFVRRLIMAAKGRAVDRPNARPVPVMQRYASAVIASLAMSESVGIYGLILYLLGKDTVDLYLLLGISAAAMIYYRPQQDELAGLSQRQP